MKTLKKINFLLLITVVLFALSSCNKKNPGNSDFGSGTVKAKIDGTSITFKNVTAAKAIGLITISATDNNNKSLTFTMPDNISEGTYDLSNDDVQILILYQNENSESGGYFSISGELKITKHNEGSNKLDATFNFKGEDFNNSSVNVTDGSIDIKYDEAN